MKKPPMRGSQTWMPKEFPCGRPSSAPMVLPTRKPGGCDGESSSWPVPSCLAMRQGKQWWVEHYLIREARHAESSERTLYLTMILINLVLFQIGWFACVLSGAAQRPWIGALIATVIVLIHLLRADAGEAELKLVLIAVVIGAVWDSLLVWQNWLQYSSGILIPNTAPYWIILMWALFATILNVSLRWLRGRWVIAALAGAVGGPLAYYGGHRLGALQFGNELVALMALAIGWAIFTPILMALSARFDGYAQVLKQRMS